MLITFKFQLSHFLTSSGYNNGLPKYGWSIMNASNDPLHGKKLADILDELLDYYGGFEGLSVMAPIKSPPH